MDREINWQGPSHVHTEKGAEWYWAVGIISLSIVVASILLNNYIFALFVVLATFTLIIFASKGPRTIDIRFTEKGVLMDNLFYPYESIESFWVENNEEETPKIILKSNKILIPYISFPVHHDDPEELREFLLDYLKEEQLEELVLHRIMERLGF